MLTVLLTYKFERPQTVAAQWIQLSNWRVRVPPSQPLTDGLKTVCFLLLRLKIVYFQGFLDLLSLGVDRKTWKIFHTGVSIFPPVKTVLLMKTLSKNLPKPPCLSLWQTGRFFLFKKICKITRLGKNFHWLYCKYNLYLYLQSGIAENRYFAWYNEMLVRL